MKVFKVITERLEDKCIVSDIQYVSSEDLSTVFSHFMEHCTHYNEELKGVTEVLTILKHIEKGDLS